jgi:hypothetical protein
MAMTMTDSVTILIINHPDIELWSDTYGEPYATIKDDEGKRNYAIRSKEFAEKIRNIYWLENGTGISRYVMTHALDNISGHAKFAKESKKYEVFTRVAEQNGSYYLDLANGKGQVVQFTKDGWNVLDDSPVKFRRPLGLGELPVPKAPENGQTLDRLLYRNVNVKSDDVPLVREFCVQCLFSAGPYAILAITGEPGSGKSKTVDRIKSIVDPNRFSITGSPRSEEDLIITAQNMQVLAYDNLSSIPNWLSDALCRVATGGGLRVRKLYAQGEEWGQFAKNPIILSSISGVMDRPDLLDRFVQLELPVITAERRKDEKELDAEFKKAHPQILGALLDVTVATLAALPGTKYESIPEQERYDD